MTSTTSLALVTGASSGMGAEYARQLAAQGWDLALTARRRERLECLAEELADRHSIRTRVIAADLAEADAPAAICEQATEDGATIGLLVNNAGYALPGKFQDSDWSEHRKFLCVMVDAVAELCWRVLPEMRRLDHGGIINVASLAGIVPGAAGHTLYAAVKAFMIRFSESLAMENEDAAVKVQAFCPGFTYTEFHDVVGTRDQVSKMPEFMWMSAARAVQSSLETFARPGSPVVVVPGKVNKALAMLARKLPYRVGYDLVRRQAGKVRRQ